MQQCLVLYLVVRHIDQVIFYCIYILNLILVLIFGLYFIWRFIYAVLIILGGSCMDSRRPLCSWTTIGNTYQYVLRWFFLGREGFKYGYNTYISGHSPGCCSICNFDGCSFLGIHPACRSLYQSFLLQLDTIFQHISLLQIGTRILCSMLSWDLVSSQLVGKCQTLTCIKSCGYVGLELSLVLSKMFSNCLCSIRTRQLEILLNRARPDSPKSTSEFLP